MLGLGLVLGATGCFEPSAEAIASLEAVKAAGQESDRQLDALEERFLGAQTRVFLWRELADRHQKISEISCNNATTHAVGMMQHQNKERRKERRKTLARSTLTQNSVVAERRRGPPQGRF